MAAVAALAAPAAASAGDRYAEPGGNGPSGAGQCLQSDPCSIQTAVENAAVADGDRILLLAGPYALGTDQLQITDDITVEPAAGLPRQTLSSSWAMSGGAVDVTGTASGAVLRKLLISHGGGSAIAAGLSLSGATGERLYVVSDGFLACGLTSGTLRDSVCFLTAAADSSAIGAVGTSVGGMATYLSRIRNVTGISKEPNAPGLVLSAVAGADLEIDGLNVIAEGPGYDVFASSGAGSAATIALRNSNYPVFDAAGAGGSVTPNTTAGNQAAAPLFTNFAGNSFSQATGSPTIDAGASDALVGSLDVDDDPRAVQGKAGCPNASPDIGAYEAPAVAALTCAGQPPTAKKKCKKKKKKRRKSAGSAKKKRKKKCKRRKKGKKRA
jgi:hypothetical protein